MFTSLFSQKTFREDFVRRFSILASLCSVSDQSNELCEGSFRLVLTHRWPGLCHLFIAVLDDSISLNALPWWPDCHRAHHPPRCSQEAQSSDHPDGCGGWFMSQKLGCARCSVNSVKGWHSARHITCSK